MIIKLGQIIIMIMILIIIIVVVIITNTNSNHNNNNTIFITTTIIINSTLCDTNLMIMIIKQRIYHIKIPLTLTTAPILFAIKL